MIVRTERQRSTLVELGRIAHDTLRHCLEMVQPGVTGLEIDAFAAEFFSNNNVKSAPIEQYQFPASVCVSVGNTVAHGVPNDVPFEQGDMVNIDVSLTRDDVWVDTGRGTTAGEPTESQKYLLEAVYTARSAAVHAAKPGKPYIAVAQAVERTARRYGLTVIENLGGHGTGGSLHEPPYLSNVSKNADTGFFRKGQVVAVEPILSYKSTLVQSDGPWHLTTDTQAAQAEHTIIINTKPEILT